MPGQITFLFSSRWKLNYFTISNVILNFNLLIFVSFLLHIVRYNILVISEKLFTIFARIYNKTSKSVYVKHVWSSLLPYNVDVFTNIECLSSSHFTTKCEVSTELRYSAKTELIKQGIPHFHLYSGTRFMNLFLFGRLTEILHI